MRVVIRVLITACALFLAAALVPGIELRAGSAGSRAGTLIVNALLLWLTSWVAGKLSLPFHITGFWPAFWGAIIIGVVSWLLSLGLDEDRLRNRQSR